MRSNWYRRLLACTLLIACVAISDALAQMPRAGQNFTFGVIEGPDQSSTISEVNSTLYLTIVSLYDGCASLTSPNGYSATFNFVAGREARIKLDHSLMHLNDLGKTTKGLLLHTSQPANVMLHDYAPQAGDATQILPDEALDTAYVVSTFGLYNDIFDAEDNHDQFLITAAQDNTSVTVTPSVTTMLNQPAGVPFTITLNRGECYIVKADTTSKPVETSLSGSVISTTHAVSVITGITCAYVPAEVESCNEVMDELTGKRWWGTHFFVEPLGNDDKSNSSVIVITGYNNFFATVNGAPSTSTRSRIQAQISGPVELTTTEPVEVQQFSRGSSLSNTGISDPTMITILPIEQYVDTMIWSTPASFGDGNSFANTVPIVFPSAAEASIKLDGLPILTYGVPNVINGSNMSGLIASVNTGVHFLTSPEPVSALVTGFNSADAYSFIPGTIGSFVPHDTLQRTLLLSPDPATTCTAFGVTASLDSAFTNSESVSSLRVVFTFDQGTLTPIRLERLGQLLSSTILIDSSVPGKWVIDIIGKPFITGTDLFRLVFNGRKASGSTTISDSVIVNSCNEFIERIVSGPVAFAVAAGSTTLTRDVALSASAGVTCKPVTLTLTTDQSVVPEDDLVPLSIDITYDPSYEQLITTTIGALLQNLPVKGTSNIPGEYALDITSPEAVSGSNNLLTLTLAASKKGTAVIHAHITFLLCGDTISKDLILNTIIGDNIDSTTLSMSITAPTVTYGNIAAADVTVNGVPASAHVRQFDLYLRYNHNLLMYVNADLGGTLTNGWQQPVLTPIDENTERLTFTSPGTDLGVSGMLAHLLFRTFISDSASTPISIVSSLADSSACSVVYESPAAQTVFMGKDLCGDSVLRSYLRHQSITIDRVQTLSNGTLDLSVITGHTGVVHFTILNELGQVVYSEDVDCSLGQTTLTITLPPNVASDQYIVRAELGGFVSSRRFVIIH